MCPYKRFLDAVGISEAGSKKPATTNHEGGNNTSPRKGISEKSNLQIIVHFLRVPKVLLLLLLLLLLLSLTFGKDSLILCLAV